MALVVLSAVEQRLDAVRAVLEGSDAGSASQKFRKLNA
jgi:hypothetical protein